MTSSDLLTGIQGSIQGMQEDMQKTYKLLADQILTGESSDGTVKITMSATYQFNDIHFDEKALQGGVKEFKWRIKEAWKNLCEQIQQTTQAKTVELLQSMDIPDEIKNLSTDIEGGEGGEGGESGTGGNTIIDGFLTEDDKND